MCCECTAANIFMLVAGLMQESLISRNKHINQRVSTSKDGDEESKDEETTKCQVLISSRNYKDTTLIFLSISHV